MIDTNVLSFALRSDQEARSQLAALLTSDYLAQRAERGSRARFEQALAKVPAAPPEAQDA